MQYSNDAEPHPYDMTPPPPPARFVHLGGCTDPACGGCWPALTEPYPHHRGQCDDCGADAPAHGLTPSSCQSDMQRCDACAQTHVQNCHPCAYSMFWG